MYNSAIGVLLTLLAAIPLAHAAPAAWIARSNALAEPVLQDRGKFNPEFASFNGSEEFDMAVQDLAPQVFERRVASMEARRNVLRALREKEADSKVQQDLDILIRSLEQDIATQRLEHQYLLGYVNAPEVVFFGLKALLDPRNQPARQARALQRLKRYAGLEAGFVPLATLARARMEEELARPGLIGPYREEIKQALTNADFYLKGIPDLFVQAKLAGWESDFAVLGQQLRDYNEWTQQAVLPRTRTEVRLPAVIYADQLMQMGVDISPDELIERAAFDFQEVRDQMQLLARQIAASRHLPSSDYREVIHELKKHQVKSGDLLPMYRKRLGEIEAIIRREKLVSLPDRKANIRAATEAEAARVPAPQMNPPRMIGNTGEYGEFLIPLTNPHARTGAKMDDFS
ncbi:MAG: DUF885 family protein [Proteobacteria bacterium]|nr:DUF885 family protein [Pseudomonadota bacterium]